MELEVTVTIFTVQGKKPLAENNLSNKTVMEPEFIKHYY